MATSRSPEKDVKMMQLVYRGWLDQPGSALAPLLRAESPSDLTPLDLSTENLLDKIETSQTLRTALEKQLVPTSSATEAEDVKFK